MTAQQPLSTWLACLACLSSASAGAAELRHEWFADTQTLAFNLVVDEATPLFDTFEFRAQADGEAAFGSQPQPVTISHAGEGGSGFNLWLYGCPTCFGGPPSLFGAGLLLNSEELSGSWARLGMPINEPPIHGHFADLFIAQVQLETPGPVNVSIDLYRSGSIVESHLALYNVPEPGAAVAACLAIAAAAARTRFRRWLCLPASSAGQVLAPAVRLEKLPVVGASTYPTSCAGSHNRSGCCGVDRKIASPQSFGGSLTDAILYHDLRLDAAHFDVALRKPCSGRSFRSIG